MRTNMVVRSVAAHVHALDECLEMVRTFDEGSAAGSGPHARVLRDVEHILKVLQQPGAIVGGLAVIHHGYPRYTRDVDIVLPAETIAEFLRIAPLRGFRVARKDKDGWCLLIHKESGMDLHLVPEGAKPAKKAPTTIPGPKALGVTRSTLGFPTLPRLIELKIAAGRLKDQADVVELLKQNWRQRARIREHVSRIHHNYAVIFDRLVSQAQRERSHEQGPSSSPAD